MGFCTWPFSISKINRSVELRLSKKERLGTIAEVNRNIRIASRSLSAPTAMREIYLSARHLAQRRYTTLSLKAIASRTTRTRLQPRLPIRPRRTQILLKPPVLSWETRHFPARHERRLTGSQIMCRPTRTNFRIRPACSRAAISMTCIIFSITRTPRPWVSTAGRKVSRLGWQCGAIGRLSHRTAILITAGCRHGRHPGQRQQTFSCLRRRLLGKITRLPARVS